MEPLGPGDPEKIDKYQLIGVLGQGGMGRVYLGKSPDDMIVAVKVMKREHAGNPHFAERFRREMRSAEVLGNGYTAALVGCDQDAVQPWLATKFIVGASLGVMVDPDSKDGLARTLDLAAVWWLAFGLIKALTEIHACGIVHRDLKPANVILAADGPKVIDFGIALGVRGYGLEASRLTEVEVRVGTPAFMSPEQLRYEHEIGPATDIFSLGTVLVYAATGMVPDRGGQGRVLWDHPVLRSVPRELLPLLERCLRTHPADRAQLPELLSIVLDAKRGRYEQAEPSFWPLPMASRVVGMADKIRRDLPPAVAGNLSTVPDGAPRSREQSYERSREDEAGGETQRPGAGYQKTQPYTQRESWWAATPAGPSRLYLYPAYRPVPAGSGVLDRYPGQERGAAEWAIEGDRYLSAEKYDDAERAYRASLLLDPGNAVVLVDLGRTLCPRGRMQEAEKAFTGALAVSPRLIAARRNLYLAVHHMGGDVPTARRLGEELGEACRAVLKLPAADAEEYANLGDAHYTLGHCAEGGAAYQEAMRLDAGNPRLKEKYERAAQGCR